MSILLNFKICDNCADCSGVAVCPVHAITWNEDKKTIEIDNTKCISCGLCEKSCTIKAIKLAKTKAEYDKIKKEIDDDPRTVRDLFIERYGAMKIADINCFDISRLEARINSNRPVIIELNMEETVNCLLNSVPISDIQKQFDENATYSKFYVTKDELQKYNLKETPVLRFYNNGKLLGEIVGYFSINDKWDYYPKIREFAKLIDKK